MRLLRIFVFTFSALIGHSALAQDVLPDRFMSLSTDTDAPGQDLGPIFNTTLEACTQTCRADSNCAAFTFNTRNGACFPKAGIGETAFYEGAVTGVFRPTDPAALSRLDDRLAQLDFLSPGDFDRARVMAQEIGTDYPTQGRSAEEWRTIARLSQNAAPTDHTGWTLALGAAIGQQDRAADWTGYARALLTNPNGSSSDRQ